MQESFIRTSKHHISSLTLIAILLIFVIGCRKENEKPPAPETGTMIDIEGNVYSTVKIGGKWWMAENLKVATYRNGSPIFQTQSSTDWQDTTAVCCVYDNNTHAPGLLYNWYAVNHPDHLAPEGWHVPTDAEWKELELNLGMSNDETDKSGWRGTDEGEKLKFEGTQSWVKYGNVWATNESGFSALAGSCRLYNGIWGNPGLYYNGFWWSATENSTGKAWYRHLDYKNANVFRSSDSKSYGFSVRCVKD